MQIMNSARAIKGDDGVPMADPSTYPGLVKVFDLAAQGKTDIEVARALNADGYRTVGPRGNLSFAFTIVGVSSKTSSTWATYPTARVVGSKGSTERLSPRLFGIRPTRCEGAGAFPPMLSVPRASN